MMERLRQVADAVMYEGYLLYPYRVSSVKNRQRWTFGTLKTPAAAMHDGSASHFQCQFLISSREEPELSVTVRFLHLRRRGDGIEEGIAREVEPGSFYFLPEGAGVAVCGVVTLLLQRQAADLYRATLRVINTGEDGDELAALASAHAIVETVNGSFVSLADPPERYSAAAAECINLGVWPVLAGEPGVQNALLISPIILPDYPQIAEESAGDLFDATEIDEILSLRILTLTDAEKECMRAGDPRAAKLLARTESLTAERLLKLHGVLRDPALPLKRGDKVRLRPRASADIFDLALAGQIAEIEAVERDYENRVHLAVVLDEDPGKDLGLLRQPGHRFFFAPDEVELLERA